MKCNMNQTLFIIPFNTFRYAHQFTVNNEIKLNNNKKTVKLLKLKINNNNNKAHVENMHFTYVNIPIVIDSSLITNCLKS